MAEKKNEALISSKTDCDRHENVLRIRTVYTPVLRVTQGGRVIGLGMNYGYHMSKAGAHS